ncbi:hypothetical protein AAG570_000028, partial [Ranatra chinensis]
QFLQNLGKVDRTLDDIFDEHLENFQKQQSAAARLQKEFNNYIRCIRAVQAASKSLFECVNEVYESGWVGQDVLCVQTQSIEMLWQDLSHKLADQVLLPLNTYYAQFPEMKKKIDKRSRKLVDYDGQRHNLQSLEGGGGKKRDETKITKAKEQLQVAKRTYDALNSELHDDLPALYHSRILFLVNSLQTMFSAEQVFHSETSKVYSELEAIIDKLATDSQKQSYTPKKMSNSPQENNVNKMRLITNRGISAEETVLNSSTPPGSPVEVKSPEPTTVTETTETHTENLFNNPTESVIPDTSDNQTIPNDPAPPSVNGNSEPCPPVKEANNNKQVEDLYDIPLGATTENLPPGVLYRVKATYKYNREDVDELSFDVGEVIRVIQYDDPEEQEDGWLMGLKEITGEKGMFPANFTRPL